MLHAQKGDHFILENGRAGFVINIFECVIGHKHPVMIIKFIDGSIHKAGYDDNGIYLEDGFHRFTQYFKKSECNT